MVHRICKLWLLSFIQNKPLTFILIEFVASEFVRSFFRPARALACFLWMNHLHFVTGCSVRLIFVSDSPSSVVNKQLGSMTLDEEQGASFFFLHLPLFLTFLHLLVCALSASLTGKHLDLSLVRRTPQMHLSENLKRDTEAFSEASSVHGQTLKKKHLDTFPPYSMSIDLACTFYLSRQDVQRKL